MQSITEAQAMQLQRAKTELLERKATFVLVNGSLILDSQKRGVAPILDILSGESSVLKHALVADKVIGRAAALLLVLGGIDAIDTHLISDHAIDIFKKYVSSLYFQYSTGERTSLTFSNENHAIFLLSGTIIQKP